MRVYILIFVPAVVFWKDRRLSFLSPGHVFQGWHRDILEACSIFPYDSNPAFKSVEKQRWTGHFPLCEDFSSSTEI